MKTKLSIALIIIVAMFGIAVAQDETPTCDPLTQPCYAPPCEWMLIVVDGTTEEVCIVPDGDGDNSWFGWL